MEWSKESSDGSVTKSLEYGDKIGMDSYRMKVAEREQLRVSALKIAMILILTFVTIALSTAAYMFLAQNEQEIFEKNVSTYESNGRDLISRSAHICHLSLKHTQLRSLQCQGVGSTLPSLLWLRFQPLSQAMRKTLDRSGPLLQLVITQQSPSRWLS